MSRRLIRLGEGWYIHSMTDGGSYCLTQHRLELAACGNGAVDTHTHTHTHTNKHTTLPLPTLRRCLCLSACSVDHLVSNDVLEYEIQLLASNADKLDDNDKAIRCVLRWRG
jgi:hypothetical protein